MPASIKTELRKGESFESLAEVRVYQNARIASDDYAAGYSPYAAIKQMAKRYKFGSIGCVIIVTDEKHLILYGYDLAFKTNLKDARHLESGVSKWKPAGGNYSTIERLTNTEDYTLYIMEQSEEDLRKSRRKAKADTDPYGVDTIGIFPTGKSRFYNNAADETSELRPKYRISKLGNADVLSFKLDGIQSLRRVYEAVKRTDIKGIEIDGVYLMPFNFKKMIDFEQSFMLNGPKLSIRELFIYGRGIIGRIEGFDEYVDVFSDFDVLRKTRKNYDLIATANGERVSFHLELV